ncbi:MAG: four helix bundle protein [Patescibacteria group bacterium]|jgi:four helix bundle protein
MNSYKELTVWQKSIELVTAIYKLTEQFPKSEIFGLTSQIKRSAVSIPSNIAEGFNRKSRLEYAHFIRIAFGSGAELETQILIAKKLKFINETSYNQIDALLTEVMKMLNKLISALKS